MDKRDEDTLFGIIQKCVPMSANIRIVLDCWASYNKLKDLGYGHDTVIHEKEFVNENGNHTNSIESFYSQVKMWMNAMHGVKEDCFDRYLCEFICRYNYAICERSQ